MALTLCIILASICIWINLSDHFEDIGNSVVNFFKNLNKDEGEN